MLAALGMRRRKYAIAFDEQIAGAARPQLLPDLKELDTQ